MDCDIFLYGIVNFELSMFDLQVTLLLVAFSQVAVMAQIDQQVQFILSIQR